MNESSSQGFDLSDEQLEQIASDYGTGGLSAYWPERLNFARAVIAADRAAREQSVPVRYQCAQCKTPLQPGWSCGKCGSDEAEEMDSAAPKAPQSDALRDIAAERARQQSVEGWTPETDDAYTTNALARAAACYALGTDVAAEGHATIRLWPWAPGWWKPKDKRRNLVRAAALLLAEIERLDRAAMKEQSKS